MVQRLAFRAKVGYALREASQPILLVSTTEKEQIRQDVTGGF